MRTKNIPPARAPPPRQEPKPAPGEEHIPAIIADAAIELETAPEEVADNPDEWAAGYNCYGWPFLLKTRILEAVSKS